MAKGLRNRDEARNEAMDHQGGGALHGSESFGDRDTNDEMAESGIVSASAGQNGGGEAVDKAGNDGVVTKGRPHAAKVEAFKRLCDGRTSTALDAMGRLRHLANTDQYAFTGEQADKVVAALQGSLDAIKASFDAALAPAPEGGKKKAARQLSFRV